MRNYGVLKTAEITNMSEMSEMSEIERRCEVYILAVKYLKYLMS